jgi:acyl-CoA hydrolase
MNSMTSYQDDYEKAARKIIADVGDNVVIGLPLGLGKPVGLINALYRIAQDNHQIKLTIITALTLAKPELKNELEKRFVEPFLDRILKNYEEPLYEQARVEQRLPVNIKVIEFFLSTAKFLHNNYVQQNYISSSYTNVARDTAFYEMNVIAQQVSHRSDDPGLYSLSCNSDLFHDVMLRIKASNKRYAIVAEVNNNLPFMHGDAVIEADVFTDIIDTRHYRTLFAIPHDELSIEDQLIGFYTSTLIKDDSCLQIGIGKLSNALTTSLILRHNDNPLYQELLREFHVIDKFGDCISKWGGAGVFNKGLYASTEMLCDGYLQLYKQNILKKYVYDNAGLQRLINSGKITENISYDILDHLLESNIIHTKLTEEDVVFLKKYGIFETDVQWADGQLLLANGEKIPAQLDSQHHKNAIVSECLGKTLKSGIIAHAGFFLGTSDLYQQLLDLDERELAKINMTAIARTNSLLWDPELLTLQRQHARFVNSAMMVTLGCVLISDGLKNMIEVSGVGGQFDFLDMAANLEGSRSIINCRSTRTAKGITSSNIIWEYPNMTIARYLRDIVITEYGIADCRSKTDCEVIKTMLNVTDSRYQTGLLNTAKRAGKVPADYQIPPIFQKNYPDVIEPIVRKYQQRRIFEPYPFGTELTAEELVLKKALVTMGDYSKWKALGVLAASLFYWRSDLPYKTYLQRMRLEHTANFKDLIYKKLIKFMLRKSV